MIKKIKLAYKRLALKARMHSTCSEIEAAVKRIEHDQELIAMLWQERADLQAKAYWLEKDNMSINRMAV